MKSHYVGLLIFAGGVAAVWYLMSHESAAQSVTPIVSQPVFDQAEYPANTDLSEPVSVPLAPSSPYLVNQPNYIHPSASLSQGQVAEYTENLESLDLPYGE